MSTGAQTVKRWEHCPSCDSSTGIRELGRQWVCLECSHRFNKPVEKVSAEDYTALERRVPTWQPIETAPKGSWLGGPNRTDHPDYVSPPRLLLWTSEGMACGYADAYYAEGGRGYNGGSFWVENSSGERLKPTQWMPLPAPPDAGGL